MAQVTKAILFNGPPGSGKDTAAKFAFAAIDQRVPDGKFVGYFAEHMKFATPLKAAAHVLYGIPYSCEHYEKIKGYEWKNNPQPEFYGKKPRDVYISLSEEYTKKENGTNHFGNVAVRQMRLARSKNVFIFSDSGFVEEAIPVIKECGVENVLVVQLSREGCNFSSDSRGYIGDALRDQFPKLKVLSIPNDFDKMMFRVLVRGAVCPWLNLDADT